MEYFDLDDDRYLRRVQRNKDNKLKKAIDKQLQQRHHTDYHHYDFFDVEIFCDESIDPLNNRKRKNDMQDLKKEFRKMAQKKGQKKANRHTDYHAFRILGCLVYCPEDICDFN